MRVIVKFYLKNIFSKIKNNFKNISFKIIFSYLKSIFNCKKNKLNILNIIVQSHFHSSQLTFGVCKIQTKLALNRKC